jgi:amidase
MDAIELAFAGADRQVALLAAGEVSARELVELYLERIARLNPTLNAYRVVLAEEALAEADRAQARLDAGERLPLLGVPVAIKDDADVAGQVTACGSLAYGAPRTQDSALVRRLREAGAIVLGKTHVPALTHSPYTESLAFGATRNPWDLGRTPGGSSGGRGAALAAGLAGVALGSDGGGSIRIPATWCGLFGIKPQRGRVAAAPYEDAWQGMAHYGPLGRTVRDAARFLDATTELPSPPGGFLEAAGRTPERLRIAVSTKLPPGVLARPGAAQRRAVEETAALLRGLGHDVVPRDPDYPNDLWAAANIRILRGIYDQGAAMEHPDRFEPRVRAIMRAGRLIPDRLVAWARSAEREQAARIGTLFQDVDVLLTLGCLDGPYPIGAHHGHGFARWAAVAPNRIAAFPAFNITGQPACVVPSGRDDDGLPLSVQLVGRVQGEATLLALAAQLEDERPWAQDRPPLATA